MIDYYEILQLSPASSEETIAEQYQLLSDSQQPDVFPDGASDECLARAEAELRLLNEAYGILHDADRRRAYDRERNIAIAAAKESSDSVSEEMLPLQLVALRNDSPSSEVPSATARSPRRTGRWDVRLVAAFLAGMLIASIVLVGKYWYVGSQGKQSFVARLLSTAQLTAPARKLIIKQYPDKPPVAPSTAAQYRGVRPLNKQIPDIVTQAMLVKPRQKSDAADGQIGAARRDNPVSADIILAKGQQMFGAQQIGNVEVFYPDGFQDCWTTKGNCGQPHVAADGTVGWIVYQVTKSGNYNFQPNGTVVLRRRGQVIQKIGSTYDYIDEWGFLEHGSKVILRTRQASGRTLIERYESDTGRLLDSVDASRSDLPSWVFALLDR